MKFLTIAFIGLLGFCIAGNWETVIKGTPTRIHPNWYQLERDPSPYTRIKLYIALKDRNLDELEAYALDISDPHSPNYGKQLTFKQIIDWVAPEPEVVEKVISWLRSEGVEEYEVTETRNFITIKTSVQIAERLLGCSFHYFEHVEAISTDKQILRCTEAYSVPASLNDYINIIAPVHGFSKKVPSQVRREKYERQMSKFYHERQFQPNVTPDVVYQRYNVTLGNTDFKVNNTQAVWEDSDSYDPQDLQMFFQQFKPILEGQKVAGIRGNAGNQPGTGDAEAALDIEYIMATGSYAPSYFYNYNSSTEDIFPQFIEWVMDLSNDPQPPFVHSISYGEYGGDYPIGFVDQISDEWMKLGTRGLTFFVASGDDGVGCNDNGTAFEFPYPSSPWITLVGSTQLQQPDNKSYYEIGSDFSSGGFSNDFGIPKWQAKQVAYYLQNAKGLPPASFYNSSGRALPDIATVGENVQIVLDQSAQPVDGTSCSAPIFAGMVSLLNGWRLKNNKSPLGFINPLLYTAYSEDPSTFWDVTQGNNSDPPCPGFPAWQGWDPVTGLGTPNFVNLFAYIQKLP